MNNRKLRNKKQENDSVNYIVLGLAVLLLVVSVVQTYQVSALEEKMSTGGISVVGPSPTAGGVSAPAAAPSRSAPTMVGGC